MDDGVKVCAECTYYKPRGLGRGITCERPNSGRERFDPVRGNTTGGAPQCADERKEIRNPVNNIYDRCGPDGKHFTRAGFFQRAWRSLLKP